ncbi:MAG: rhombosortase [Desulfobacteraceae bacterium]|nr:rhombosortase [Desulfobacteraceae bacterium]
MIFPELSFAAHGSFRHTHRRLGADVLLFAGLVVLLNLHLVGIGSPLSWVFFPQALIEGQWWRLLTHPLVHVSPYHLFLDGGAFVLLYHGLSEKRAGRKLAYVGVAGLSSLAGAMAFAPQLGTTGLCGLSGIAHGLMAVSGLEMIGDGVHRRTGWITFGCVAGKSLYEVYRGEVVFEFLHMGMCGVPLAACHLGGVVGATLLFWGFQLNDRLVSCPTN